jgi:hypothetical protein
LFLNAQTGNRRIGKELNGNLEHRRGHDSADFPPVKAAGLAKKPGLPMPQAL